MISKVKQDLIYNKHVQVDIIHRHQHPVVLFHGIIIILFKMVPVQVKLEMVGPQYQTKVGLIQEEIIQLLTKTLQLMDKML